MLTILLLTVAVLVLPVLGEIWKHGEDNVVTQMRVEAREIAKPYTATAEAAYAKLRESFTWWTILTLIAALIKVLVEVVSDILREIRSGK